LKRLQSISIRYAIPGLFAVFILLTAGVIGGLAYFSGRMAVYDLAEQLSADVTERIREHVVSFIGTPGLFHKVNLSAVEAGRMDLEDFEALEDEWWNQVQITDSVPFIYFGSADGEFFGIESKSDGDMVVWVLDESTKPDLVIYQTDEDHNRLDIIDSIEYDPRVRPWYIAAKDSGTLTWSSIYADISRPILIITSAMPVYDAKGALLGVMGIEFSLEQLSEFLRGLEISENGEAFIVDQDGDIVAGSSVDVPYTIVNDEYHRLSANDVSDPLISETAIYLIERFGAISKIRTSDQLNYKLDGELQFVHVANLEDGHGLHWLIVVVIPETDIMAPIITSLRSSALISIIFMLLAIGVGLGFARSIIRPLLMIMGASAAIEREEFDSKRLLPVIERKDELGQLAGVIQSMGREVAARQKRLNLLKVIIPIGVSLSAERDFDQLLETILIEAKKISNADAGTLYLRNDKDQLEFVIVRNDSLGINMGGSSEIEVNFPVLPMYGEDGKPNYHNVATYAAISKETVNIEDAYEAHGFDFSGTRAFDARTGYRSKSFLTIPLEGKDSQIIGVLQLINAIDPECGEVSSFEVDDVIDSLILLASAALQGYIREQELREQVQRLRIQVDEAKRKTQVSEIVETDFFKQLLEKVQILRFGRKRRSSTDRESGKGENSSKE
jgi:hypothetical protein